MPAPSVVMENRWVNKAFVCAFLKVCWILNKYELGALINQALKSDFKTHVKKKNLTSRTDSNQKTL